jgi:hypothetical protein
LEPKIISCRVAPYKKNKNVETAGAGLVDTVLSVKTEPVEFVFAIKAMSIVVMNASKLN